MNLQRVTILCCGRDLSVVSSYDGLGYRKPNAVAAGLGASGRIQTIKPPKDMGQILLFNRNDGGVPYRQMNITALSFYGQGYFSALRRVFHCIVQQNIHQLADGFFVAVQRKHGFHAALKLFPTGLGDSLKGLGGLADHIRKGISDQRTQ